MITIRRYDETFHAQWNAFVENSKNGTFLFHRDYMDYHHDRFADHSLLFYQGKNLVALLTANAKEGVLYSHQGLTYGGFITDRHMRSALMLEIFDALQVYAKQQQWGTIHYKAVPHIYHRYPAEEDLYALFRANAQLVRVDVSTALPLATRWGLHQGKKTGASRAKKAGVTIRPDTNFDQFFSIAEARLMERYSTVPVHTAAEMKLLASRFPDNIKLFCAYIGDRMVAGVIVYISDRVVHTQYISSTEEGRDVRAVDLLIAELIETWPGQQHYFDFGISNEQQGKVLNTGLVSQKEEFGARSIVHQTFLMSIS